MVPVIHQVDLPSRRELRDLASPDQSPCVSLYLPTHRVAGTSPEDLLRLKNLVTEAETQLHQLGADASTVVSLLTVPRELLQREVWWRYTADGLAILTSRWLVRFYRLPVPVEELCVVGERFHLGPLYGVVEGDVGFWVLWLDEGGCRLFYGSRYQLQEIALDSDVSELEPIPEPPHLQFHTRTAGEPGARPAMFHGQGGGADSASRVVAHWMAHLDNAVRDRLRDSHRPLLLAGNAQLCAAYRRANRYGLLLGHAITNAERVWPVRKLHEQAWRAVLPVLQAPGRAAVREFSARYGRGDGKAIGQLPDSVIAAAWKRVDTLLIPDGQHRWGRYHRDTDTVEPHARQQAGDNDLLDVAAQETLAGGGRVFSVARDDVPDGTDLPAILR